MNAINLIRGEHRSIAAVLDGLTEVIGGIRDRGEQPNLDLLGSMIYYLDAFPERYHHPKENLYLFSALRKRHPDAAPLLDRLEDEHRIGAEKIRRLEQALQRYRSGGAGEFPSFAAIADDYVAFELAHVSTEETEVIPLAREFLTGDDWTQIDAAFASHDDPLVGIDTGDEYERLFSRIVNLAPPPIGIGPPAAAAAKGEVRE